MSEASTPKTEATGTGEQMRSAVDAYRHLDAAYDLAEVMGFGRIDEGCYAAGNSVLYRLFQSDRSISGRWTPVNEEEAPTYHDFRISEDGEASVWVYKGNEVEKEITGREGEKLAIEVGLHVAEEVGAAARQKALDLIAAYDAVVGTPEAPKPDEATQVE